MTPVFELDGRRLSRLLRAGIQRLLADQEHLNKINVFPVPDGDTGHEHGADHARRAGKSAPARRYARRQYIDARC